MDAQDLIVLDSGVDAAQVAAATACCKPGLSANLVPPSSEEP